MVTPYATIAVADLGEGAEMNGKDRNPGLDTEGPMACQDCQGGLQEYMDGTLDKTQSLRFFLHLRDCSECHESQLAMQGIFDMLENLPSHEVPADFDDAILASVPYAAYREMEPLRRERVPVYLEEHFLPQLVRSQVTRASGIGVAVLSAAGVVLLDGPMWLPAVAIAGVMPEILVRAQGLGRWVVGFGNAGRAEG